MKHALLTEHESDQQPPYSAIAVEEGMDRLELCVRQTCPNERWTGVVMHELLECTEMLQENVRGRRNENRVLECRTRRTDPILGPAELAGIVVLASNPLHQLTVDLADEFQRQRQFHQPCETVVHGRYVVDDFRDIEGKLGVAFDLEHQNVGQGCLSALNLRTEDGFAIDVHPDEQIRVGNELSRGVEASEGESRVTQEPQPFKREFERWIVWWQGLRDESAIPRSLTYVRPSSMSADTFRCVEYTRHCAAILKQNAYFM